MAQQPVSQAKAQATHVQQHARPWVERFARLGYASKGIVYTIVGVLALQAAIGAGGQTIGSEGALQQIASQPFGQIMLGIVALGLVGYALWRFIQAGIDSDNKGADAGAMVTRTGYAISGIIHTGLAFTAIQIITGTGGGDGDSSQEWTARLMSQPFGQWLVGIAGAIIIGVGIQQFYQAYTASFRDELKTGQMSAIESTWATRVGRLGLAARGVVFSIIGIFLIRAAYQFDPNEARGLGSALQELAEQPFGPWLLGIVAVGLIAYGIFMGVMARYRRIRLS